MRTNQDREVLPQGITTFDSSGIDEAVKLMGSLGQLVQFVGGVLNVSNVKPTMSHVFQPSPALTKLMSMDSQWIVDVLRPMLPGLATEAQVILALGTLLTKL